MCFPHSQPLGQQTLLFRFKNFECIYQWRKNSDQPKLSSFKFPQFWWGTSTTAPGPPWGIRCMHPSYKYCCLMHLPTRRSKLAAQKLPPAENGTRGERWWRRFLRTFQNPGLRVGCTIASFILPYPNGPNFAWAFPAKEQQNWRL